MGILLFILAALAVTCLVVQWLVLRPDSSRDLTPLFIPLDFGAPEQPAAVPFVQPEAAAEVPMAASAHQPADSPAPPVRAQRGEPSPWAPKAAPRDSEVPLLPLHVVRDRDGSHDAWPEPEIPESPESPDPSQTVRFTRRVDEPVQLLPGRLEVLAGDRRQQEIRFVREPGQPAELILGRERGHSMQFVTLSSHTVSRQHARFTLSDGSWSVENLSRTNPVVVNDEEVPAGAIGRRLSDGDRLEMGEVVLRFHAH